MPASDYLYILGTAVAISAVILALLIGAVPYWRDKTLAIAVGVSVILAVQGSSIMFVGHDTTKANVTAASLGCALLCFRHRHEIKTVVRAILDTVISALCHPAFLHFLCRLTLTILAIFMLFIFAAWIYAVTSVDDEIKTLVLAIPVPVIIAVLSCAPLRHDQTRAVFATFVTLILGTLVYVIVTSEGGDIKTQAIAILVAVLSAVLARGCLGYVYQRYCPRARATGATNSSFWSLPPTFLKERTL